jgi:HEPN domain-containing protein
LEFSTGRGEGAEGVFDRRGMRPACVPPRTHDLVLLHNLLESQQDPRVQEAVLQLAEVSATSRYPDDAETVTTAMASEYEHAAARVLDWARGRVA